MLRTAAADLEQVIVVAGHVVAFGDLGRGLDALEKRFLDEGRFDGTGRKS